MTRIIVCGDREWGKKARRDEDRTLLFEALDDLDTHYGIDTVICGCARGADRMGGGPCPSVPEDETIGWAVSQGVPVEHHPAHWKEHGACFCRPDRVICNYAGHRRNIEMLEQGKPNLVAAFHRTFQFSKGTLHMVEIARAAGVPTFIFPSSH